MLLSASLCFGNMYSNYFDQPAGTSKDNVLNIEGTQEVESGGTLQIKSGGTLQLDSGATATLTGTLGAVTVTTIDTGQGANEVYDMDQNVLTTSSPTFAECTVTNDASIGGTITAGSGSNVLTNATGLIDGEKIQNDTIDDDSIDFTDVTGADLTLTDCGAITSSSLITALDASLTYGVACATVVATAGINGATVNTGQGDYELYAMNQDVENTDAVTFATVDTGQGANELYDMDQNVQTTDSVTFADAEVTYGISVATIVATDAVSCTTLNTGQGDYELYAMDQDVQTTDSVTFADVAITTAVASTSLEAPKFVWATAPYTVLTDTPSATGEMFLDASFNLWVTTGTSNLGDYKQLNP